MENETKLPDAALQQPDEAAAGYPATTGHGTPRTRHRSPEEYQDLINRLNRVEGQLLGQHIRTCVVDDLEAGRYEAVDELVRVIQRLMK